MQVIWEIDFNLIYLKMGARLREHFCIWKFQELYLCRYFEINQWDVDIYLDESQF